MATLSIGDLRRDPDQMLDSVQRFIGLYRGNSNQHARAEYVRVVGEILGEFDELAKTHPGIKNNLYKTLSKTYREEMLSDFDILFVPYGAD